MGVSGQKIGKGGADTAGKGTVDRAEDPCAQQHEAVADVDIALGRGHLDLNEHGRHAGQGGKQGRQDHFLQILIFHGVLLLLF